jgi:glycosyltransferase involved in cell wall biosynthesis
MAMPLISRVLVDIIQYSAEMFCCYSVEGIVGTSSGVFLTMSKRPAVTIGVPVYNSERFLRKTLRSLLSQDFVDFELIISDNGSTDTSQQICEEFAQEDHRVKYIRHSTNQGAGWNFRYLLEAAHGDYFMWAGSHDMWEPTFVSACQAALSQDPEIAVVYTKTQLIDEEEKPLSIMEDKVQTHGLSRPKRVRIVVSNLRTGNMFYGLFRTEILRKCRLTMAGFGPDLVILMAVNILGSAVLLPEPLFLRREICRMQDENDLVAQLYRVNPNAIINQKPIRPYLQMGWQYIRSVLHAPIPALEKPYVLLNVIVYYWKRWHRYAKEDLFHPTSLDKTSSIN